MLDALSQQNSIGQHVFRISVVPNGKLLPCFWLQWLVRLRKASQINSNKILSQIGLNERRRLRLSMPLQDFPGFNLDNVWVCLQHFSSQALMLTLLWLRLYDSATFLSYAFKESTTPASRAFTDVIHVMFIPVKLLLMWPDRRQLQKTTPI